MTYSANLSFFAAKTSDTGAINSGIDGVPIGANTASTGKFTSVTNTGLTSGRVTYAGASGLLSDSANFTFNGTELILGAANPSFQGSSSTGSATLLNNSGGAFVRVYGGSHATRANYTDFINASSTSTFTSGGYLGINNTAPITNLDVVNSSASGTGAVTTVRLNHAGTTVGDGPRLLFTSGTSTTGGCAIAGYGTALNAADMLFYAGGNTERMRITSAGLVGIGTTSPGEKLDVIGGNMRVIGTASNQTTFLTTATSSDLFRIQPQAPGTGVYLQTTDYGQTAYAKMGFYATSYAFNVGNVGIGTSSPNAKLQVTTSSFPVLKVADEIGGGAIALGDAAISSNYVGIWRGAANSISGGGFLNVQGNGIAFMSTDAVFGSATRTMTLTNTGKVGIGDTAPNQLLTLGSSDGTQALSFVTSAYLGDNALIGNIEFSTHGADASYGNLVNIKAYKTGTNSNSGDLTFWTKNDGATSEKVRINKSGQVGIGTTDPIRPLQIGAYGGGNGEIAIASGTSGWGSILFGDGSSGSDFYRGYIQYQHSGDYMLFSTATAERMRINNAGNVAIGKTDDIVQRLDVSGGIRSNSSGTGSLYLGKTTSTDYNAAAIIATASTLYSPVGRLSFQLPTHGAGTDYGLTEQMFLEGTGPDSRGAYKLVILPYGGNVGIGVSNPTMKLRVDGELTNAGEGEAYVLQALYSKTSSGLGVGPAITFGGYYENTNSGFAGFASVIGFKENATSGNYGGALAFKTRPYGGSLTEAMRITSLGSIALNPNQTIATTSVLDIYGGGSGSQGALRIGDGTLSGGHPNYWDLGRDNSYTGDFTFFHNNSERMRITTGGNVGIGTSPSVKLEVLGAIRSSRSENVGYYTELKTNYSDVTTLQLNLLGNVILQAGLTNDTNLYTSGSTSKMKFYTNGTERMGITSAGVPNIGAPGNQVYNTWGGAYALQVGQSANVFGDGNFYNWNAGISLNAYRYSNAWYNISAGVPVAKFEIANGGTGSFGGFSWWWGPDAGSNQGAASWSQIMSLSSNGSLLLGTTSVTAATFQIVRPANTENYIYMLKNTQVEVTMGFGSGTNSNFYIGTGSSTVGAYGVYLSNAGSSWGSVSDERQKNIIETIQNGLEKVNSLRTVIGSYKNDPKNIRRPFLIAQDVQAVLPEAVNIQDEKTGTLGMSYTDIIPLLVASIKELKTINDTLTARITVLENK
jgi:hypothetical protein